MSYAASTERPASFREVMAGREFRAVFAASALSWFGDHAARAAVTALVFIKTESIAASAATFAISYLPWLGLGNVLTALAERYSYRQVMIISDVLRTILMTAIAMIEMPVGLLMGLLFLTATLNPPFDAARSALLPKLLDGDRYIVGLSLQKTSGQVAHIFGYLVGGGLAAYNPRLAVLMNAATFAVSALLLAFRVEERPPALKVDQRTGLLRETADGFGVVYRNRVLRAIALTVFGTACFSAAPEGLGAAWAAHLTTDPAQRGWYQAAIMMSNAVGFVVGGLIISRFVAPPARLKLIRPFAVLTPVMLVPALFNPNIGVIVAMNIACGFMIAGLLPASNGLFVQALPNAFRARAFGVMQSGLHLIQGAAILATGWLADLFSLPLVIGAWSVAGVFVMVLVTFAWPPAATISDTIAATREADLPADPTDEGHRSTTQATRTRPSGPAPTSPAPTSPAPAGPAPASGTGRRPHPSPRANGAPSANGAGGEGYSMAPANPVVAPAAAPATGPRPERL